MVLGPLPAAQCHLTSLVLHVLQGNAEQWMEGPGPRSFAEPANTYQQGGIGDGACGNAAPPWTGHGEGPAMLTHVEDQNASAVCRDTSHR